MSLARSTTLPYEVLWEAMDYAAVHSRNVILPDYRTLRNLSLVSKAVSGYAQKALFRTVLLSKNRHALAFGSALNPGTPKGRALAKLVRTLTVFVGSGTGALTQQLCTAALLACTTLHEFDLTVSNAEFDMSPFSTVFIERASPIEVLRITAPGTIALKLLRAFPSLRHVEFRGAGSAHIPQGLGPACQLVELHWPGRIEDRLFWTLQKSIGTLSVLALHNDFGVPLAFEDDSFERIMVAHGASLRSFQISYLSDSQATSLRHCTQLEELICGSDTRTYDEVFSSALLDKLPGTLHHLEVDVRADAVLTDAQCARLTHFFDTAPFLHTVTWAHPNVDGFKELRELCKRREILWRAWSHPLGTFVGERQELGPVKRFPRPVWLSPSRAKHIAPVPED